MAIGVSRRLGNIRRETAAMIILVFLLIGVFYISTRNHAFDYDVTININDVKLENTIGVMKNAKDVKVKEERMPCYQDMSIKAETSNLWPDDCPDSELGASLLPRRSRCLHPRTRLLFIQTHDPTSSTLASIILRQAYYNNLTIAAPKYHTGHIGYPNPYRPHFVYGFWFSETHFQVLAHHVRYDRCFMQMDFKLASTVYVTMLRDPWSVFVNAVRHTDNVAVGIPSKQNRIKTILKDFEKYSRPVDWNLNHAYLGNASLIRNTMSFDLGFNPSATNDKKKIDLFISRIEQDFDLVMIAEYFDESLIMLKRLMCWSLKDVFYLKPESPDVDTDEQIADDLKVHHRKYSNVDYELYDYFWKKFVLKLQTQAPNFLEEVNAFKKLNSQVNDFCSSGDVVKNPDGSESLVLTRIVPFSESVVVRAIDCKRMRKTPDDYTLLVWSMLSKRDAPTYRKMPWPYGE